MHLSVVETGTLRECRRLLQAKERKGACDLALSRPHLRLWQLIAEHSLLDLDLKTADLAFVKSSDFAGIQLVKYLQSLEDERLRRAEALIFLRQLEEAEAVYQQMDRMDLAIEMRIRAGDWLRVEKLLISGGLGDDQQLQLARNRIGEMHVERGKWDKASRYFTEARNSEALAECFLMAENYDGLVTLVTKAVPDGSPLLKELGSRFLAVGMCEEAVDCFVRAGEVQRAVDACVLLKQWDRALFLAQEHSADQVNALVDKYSAHLSAKGARFELVELLRKAGRHQEAARALMDLAKEAAESRSNPLRVKKLYLLAALEFDAFQRQALGMDMGGLTTSGKFGVGHSALLSSGHE